MKTIIVYLGLCLVIGSIYSQSTYYPLIETGKTWHVVEGDFGSMLTYTYKVEGDTVISQENFKFLFRSNEEFPTVWEKHGYIREDENKKVYYSPYFANDTSFNEPGIVYDFSANIHDTLTITSFPYNYPSDIEIVITSIDSVLIGEEYRKRSFFECESMIDNFWIEGIGSNNGLIEPGFYCSIVCPYVELLCVKEGDNVIYHNEYYQGCYIVGIDEINQKNQQFLVYPNPVVNNIYITSFTPVGKDLEFILFNLKGEIVFRKKVINQSQFEVNTTNLKEGYYLFKIIENDRLVQNGKLIIKN